MRMNALPHSLQACGSNPDEVTIEYNIQKIIEIFTKKLKKMNAIINVSSNYGGLFHEWSLHVTFSNKDQKSFYLMGVSGHSLSQSDQLTGSTTIQAGMDIKGRTDRTGQMQH